MSYENYIPLYPVRRDPRAGDDASDAAAAAAAAAAASGGGETLLGGDGEGAPFQIPEKFMVAGQDGQPDFKAIVDKIGPSYLQLEKRIGTGDLPPKTADEYKLDKFLPDGMEANPEAIKPILGEMHKLGLTQKQVQGVMSIYGQQVGTGLAAEKASFEAGQTALKTAWGDQYDQRISDAKKAHAAYAAVDPELGKLLADPKRANDPAIVRLLALAGADLNEDRPAQHMDDAATESIDEIRKSKAYTDPKDPGHADAVRKVNDAYTKGYKANRAT